jgi:hypothetical protein
MSSADAQVAFNRHAHGAFIEPMAAQENFAQQYDLADPAKALSSYQRFVYLAVSKQKRLADAMTLGYSTNTLSSNSRPRPPHHGGGRPSRRMRIWPRLHPSHRRIATAAWTLLPHERHDEKGNDLMNR